MSTVWVTGEAPGVVIVTFALPRSGPPQKTAASEVPLNENFSVAFGHFSWTYERPSADWLDTVPQAYCGPGSAAKREHG